MGGYNGKTLLASAARTTTGDSNVLNCGVGDSVCVLLAATAKTGTTPTLTCTVEWSFDKVTWYAGPTGDNFTVMSNPTLPANEFKDFTIKAPYMHVHYVFGGSATPGFTFSINAFVRN